MGDLPGKVNAVANTFQMILRSSGQITINYRQVGAPNSATVGLESWDASLSWQDACNGAGTPPVSPAPRVSGRFAFAVGEAGSSPRRREGRKGLRSGKSSEIEPPTFCQHSALCVLHAPHGELPASPITQPFASSRLRGELPASPAIQPFASFAPRGEFPASPAIQPFASFAPFAVSIPGFSGHSALCVLRAFAVKFPASPAIQPFASFAPSR